MNSYYQLIVTLPGIGGTIGMLVGQQGYVPEPYFLTETLRSQKRFNDPLQNSLFSNAGSVQGFREWSSGKSSPQSATPNGSSPTSDTPVPAPQERTFLVRSLCPIGRHFTIEDKHESTKPTSIDVSENVYEAHLPTLVTPRSKVPGGSASKSIRYAILEVGPGFVVFLFISI
jgi:lysophospholipase